jgi:hypothetical protein
MISNPKFWCGNWKDDKGKQLIIKTSGSNFYTVSVLSHLNKPYKIDLLEDGESTTQNLSAKLITDAKNTSILRVEAGSVGIGPTYDLYLLTEYQTGKFRGAHVRDMIDRMVIRPKISMGLYDDFDDDLGVSWATPFLDFKNPSNVKRKNNMSSFGEILISFIFGAPSYITFPNLKTSTRKEIKKFIFNIIIAMLVVAAFIYLAIHFG